LSKYPSWEKIEPEKRESLANEIGEILVNEVLAKMDTAQSSAEGGKWKQAKKDGSVSVLLENGDLRDSITYEASSSSVEIGVFDEREAKKAYGHMTSFKGHPSEKMRKGGYYRQFIPNTKQTFTEDIDKRIENYIELAAREGEQSSEVEALQKEAADRVAIDQLLAQRNSRSVSAIITSLFGDIFGEDN
jgi:phage gpG-like protein